MVKSYQKIIENFNDASEIKEAIISNNEKMYYYLAQFLILSNIFKKFEKKHGTTNAKKFTSATLIALQRIVKDSNSNLILQRDKLFIVFDGSKTNIELFEYLKKIFFLMPEIGSINSTFNDSKEFEDKLRNGQGIKKLYNLQDIVFSTLSKYGCKIREDKEEIFNEALIVFWKKITNREVGIYFTNKNLKLNYCYVYNRKFYHTSLLSTYIAGIAKNIFLNRTKTVEFEVSKNKTSEIKDSDYFEDDKNDFNDSILLLFMFYRIFIEKRKIRVITSLLQYECQLEDKEVKHILGINNARYHSCRLRSHFNQWYNQNLINVPDLLDEAQDYLSRRELKSNHLNKKIRTINLYQRNLINNIDLNDYSEEFQSETDFSQYYLIFKYIFYFTNNGRASMFAGLPDEEALRKLMKIYKTRLFELYKVQVLTYLLYYGSYEPNDVISSLINKLLGELKELNQKEELNDDLTSQLIKFNSSDIDGLYKEIYNTNCNLFDGLSNEDKFINIINDNEIF